MFEIFPNKDLMEHFERVMHSEPTARVHSRSYRMLLSNIEDGDGWQKCLAAAGFDRTKPTFWMLQSTLPHIEPTMVKHFLSGIDSLSAPNSTMATEMMLGGDITMTSREDGAVEYVVHEENNYGGSMNVLNEFMWHEFEVLGYHERSGKYGGRMWDDDKLGRLRVEPWERKYGPWLVVVFEKM